MLSGDAAISQESVFAVIKALFFGELREFGVLAAELICICIIAGLLSSFSYEASNDDRKHPPDERSADIRMRAKAWSFDIVTFLILVTSPLLELFDVIDSQTHAIVGVALYGILAVSWLIKAALLIFYERNL